MFLIIPKDTFICMKFLLVILKQVEDGSGTMLQQLKLGYKIGDRIWQLTT